MTGTSRSSSARTNGPRAVAVELDSPGAVEALYLERGDPTEPWRPIMTGDVFAGPQVPGCAVHELVMVLAHPCSLRQGITLVERLQSLPVGPHQAIPLQAWKGHYRVMPLPELRDEGSRPYAARLTEFGMVPREEFDLDRRLCCLTELGVVLLQQRFFHNQSRVKVGRERLFEASAPVFTEIELWTQWNEQLAEPRVKAGEDRAGVLADEAQAFDALLRSEHPEATDLRAALKVPRLRSNVRRRVLAATVERAVA
jgi:hypothetical protein